MSGTLPLSKREKLAKRLRALATGTIAAREKAAADKVEMGALTKQIEAAWRSFPECREDERVPDAMEVIEICDRMDRDAELDRKFAEGMRG
jgi:hypothetical protein